VPIRLRDLLVPTNGVREDNRLALLKTTMINPDNQVNLSKRARLSQGTVSEAVRELEGQQLVRRDNRGIVQMAETTGAVVGIELGRHAAAVVGRRADQHFEDAALRWAQVNIARGQQGWVPQVAQAVRDVTEELDQEELVAVGLGVPG